MISIKRLKAKSIVTISAYLLILMLLAIPIIYLTLLSSTKVNAKASSWASKNNKLIAHAMGSIDGISYTNSLEAFLENYKKGYRTFEVDLIFTSDNRLVACHDWETKNNGQTMKYSDFMNTKINDKYTPLDIDDIILLLQKYNDIYIITDTKDINKTNVIQAFQTIVDRANKINGSTLKRIIPQIYNQEMYSWVMNTYNFNEIIYTLYQSKDSDKQIIDFVTKNNINTVTMSESRFNKELAAELTKNNIASYVHTINSAEVMKSYESKGVFGFYTDGIIALT